MKRLGWIGLLVLSLGVPAQADEPKTVGDYIKLAEQKESNFEYGSAIEIYDAILKQFPKDFPGVYAARGEDLADVGQDRAAIKDFDMALAIDPPPPKGPQLKHDVIYEDRGKAKAGIGDYKGAIADFTKVLAVHPKDGLLVGRRADARLSSGDCAGAVSDYSAAIEYTAAGETPLSLWYDGRAIARICTGDLPAALEDYRTDIAALEKMDSTNQMTHMEHLAVWALLNHMGRKADADAGLSARLAAVGTPTRTDDEYDAAQYYLGRADGAILDRDAATLTAKQPEFANSFACDAVFFSALREVGAGNKAAALKDFRKVLTFRQHTMTVREQAQAWIRELQRKPH